VLVDVHLYLKDVIKDLKEQVKALFDLMMESAENIKMFCWLYPFTNRDAFLFWHVVSAYAESLIDDITMLNAALTVVDQNPLGSAVTEVRSRSTEPLPQKNWALKP
jgi:argininosuccinate lyase